MHIFSHTSHPHLFVAVSTALNSAGHTLLTQGISAGPLTPDMVNKAEDMLSRQPAQVKVLVQDWLDGRTTCILPPFSEAMEKSNGDDPACDVVLLLYSAISGDL